MEKYGASNSIGARGKAPGYGEVAVGGVMTYFFFEFSAPETWKKIIPSLMTFFCIFIFFADGLRKKHKNSSQGICLTLREIHLGE